MAGEELREEDHTDYESDPDDVKLSLNMRRKVASDDELAEDDDVDERESSTRSDFVGSDADDQGGVDYDDANDVEDEAEDEDENEEYFDEYEEDEVEEREIGDVAKVENADEVEGEVAEEKKEVEPFSVPTSGAFYMHDDRFRGNAVVKNRRTFGGRKLWESKDESKWGHDKFEELNLHDRRHQEGRKSSRGTYRGRGKARGDSSAYSQGSRGRGYTRDSNQNVAPKDVKGRGPRKYQPSMKNQGDTHSRDSPQYKQSVRSFDRSSHTGSGRIAPSTGSSNMEYKAVSSNKPESNLSPASLPFYPSGAPSKDIDSTQKKEMHTGNHNKNMRSSAGSNSSMRISNPILRGKNVVSTGIENLHIDNAFSPASTKTINDFHLRSSASSLSTRPTSQFAHAKGQGRVVAPSRPDVFHPSQTNNQLTKVSPQATKAYQRSPVLAQGQYPLQAPGQQIAQSPITASQSSSPPKAGKGAVQGTRKGSIVYGGAQVMGSGGNVAASHDDPNMPAFFPVMQFGGQHPGGMGVPAVGMAFPGYVSQPNGNSEMTWLPMLASAAGALGASYCPPYLGVNGNYHSKPTGQTSSLPVLSKDNTLNKPNNEIKHQQRFELANDEFNQRQNKPRRYSEMSFSQ